MIYNRFNFNIIVRVILIVSFAILIAWLLQKEGFSVSLIVVVVVFVIIIFNLIIYLNKTNRLLTFFFDAVKNEDSTLVFNESTGNKGFNTLNESLNHLNKKIQEAKIEVTIQEKYYKTILESAATAILVFNSRGTVKLLNS